jgi:hypothetical protein
MAIYGALQPISGAELVTVYQMQNGQMVTCSMPLSDLSAILTASPSTSWAANLPTAAPTAAGVVWNNNGVVSISA